jgi:hypothetical protein
MKKSLAVLSILGLVGVFWGLRASPTDENELAFNRVWISHLPQHEKDKISIFAMIDEEEIGIFDERSLFQGDFDIFEYRKDGNSILITLLQTEKKSKSSFKASRCNEKGFDFCLEIRGNQRGPSRYVSRKGWEIESTDAALALARKISALTE